MPNDNNQQPVLDYGNTLADPTKSSYVPGLGLADDQNLPPDNTTTTTTTPTSNPVQSTTITNYNPADFNTAANLGINRAEEMKGITAEKANITADEQKKEADIAANQSAYQDKEIVDRAKQLDEHSRLLGQDQSELHSLADKIGSTKVDPNHWWNDPEHTGRKVTATIGMILGGVGQGSLLWGGAKNVGNAGIEAVDNAIKQDIDSQKDNIANNWKAYSAKHDIADTRENFRRYEDTFKQASYDLGLSKFKTQLQQAMAESNSQLAKQNGAQALVALEQQEDQERRAKGQYAEQQAAQRAALIEKRRVEGLADQKQAATDRIELEKDGKLSPAEIEDRLQQMHPNLSLSSEARVKTAASPLVGKVINPETKKPFASIFEAQDFVQKYPQYFPTTKPASTERVPSVQERVETEKANTSAHTTKLKDLNTAEDIISQIRAVPDMNITKEQSDALVKAGILIPEGNPWFGGLSNTTKDRIKAVEAASEQIRKQRKETTDALHSSLTNAPKTITSKDQL